ncbi:MAG: Double zinc ribbon, partial [Planctomycetota bacterium]
MTCTQCQHTNREGVRFCTRCGCALQRLCAACHAPAEADDRWCGQCGTDLASAGKATPVLTANAAPTRAGAEALES